MLKFANFLGDASKHIEAHIGMMNVAPDRML